MIIERWEPDAAEVVKHGIRAEINGRRYEFFNDSAEDVRVNHCVYLYAEFEFVEYSLYIGGEAVQVFDEVGFELLLVGAARQVFQTKLRSIAEGLIRGFAQCFGLVYDARGSEVFFHGKDIIFCIFKHRVQAADNSHGKDNVTVLATHINITEAIVGDTPYKTHDGIVGLVVHDFKPFLLIVFQ
jgi:hypothetical protein